MPGAACRVLGAEVPPPCTGVGSPRAARARRPHRRAGREDGKIQSDLGPYVEAARAVAAERNVPLVDLHARSIELLDELGPDRAADFNIPKADGTPHTAHLVRKASEAFGSIVADELVRAVPALAAFLK